MRDPALAAARLATALHAALLLGYVLAWAWISQASLIHALLLPFGPPDPPPPPCWPLELDLSFVAPNALTLARLAPPALRREVAASLERSLRDVAEECAGTRLCWRVRLRAGGRRRRTVPEQTRIDVSIELEAARVGASARLASDLAVGASRAASIAAHAPDALGIASALLNTSGAVLPALAARVDAAVRHSACAHASTGARPADGVELVLLEATPPARALRARRHRRLASLRAVAQRLLESAWGVGRAPTVASRAIAYAAPRSATLPYSAALRAATLDGATAAALLAGESPGPAAEGAGGSRAAARPSVAPRAHALLALYAPDPGGPRVELVNGSGAPLPPGAGLAVGRDASLVLWRGDAAAHLAVTSQLRAMLGLGSPTVRAEAGAEAEGEAGAGVAPWEAVALRAGCAIGQHRLLSERLGELAELRRRFADRADHASLRATEAQARRLGGAARAAAISADLGGACAGYAAAADAAAAAAAHPSLLPVERLLGSVEGVATVYAPLLVPLGSALAQVVLPGALAAWRARGRMRID